ncbi:MAG: phosphate ABC transporter ATP-binding protein [Opitutae bacterium]
MVATSQNPSKIRIENLGVSYGPDPALRSLSMDIPRNEVFGIIGPAQSGKTTLLKTLNRTIDLVPEASVKGSVYIDDEAVVDAPEPVPAKSLNRHGLRDVCGYRRRIGMVAPLPVGLPMTIYDNVAFAPRQAGVKERGQLDEIVERCLTQAALWDEVKDRLTTLGTKLSGGQQQRLTIARALSHEPEVLCLDEFSIAIDPVTTMRIEDVLRELQSEMTIILVTNLVQQARRLARQTAFILNGELVELDDTEAIFSGEANDPRTNEFVSGIFG